MNDFEKWEAAYKRQDMSCFNTSPEAVLWLKIKDLSSQLPAIAKQLAITFYTSGVRAHCQELYTYLLEKPELRNKFENFRQFYCQKHSPGWNNTLPASLQEVPTYNWVEHYMPSLDRYFAATYLPRFPSFTALESMKEKIAAEAWEFVQNAWYDHWTRNYIEQLFFAHPRVLPSMGTLRGVDFFIDDCPMKLKLLYFPQAFLKSRKGTDVATTVNESLKDPKELLVWLYTEQCRLRFGAENRLYLIFHDTTKPENSWELKRAQKLLAEKIENYLTQFEPNRLPSITFPFGGKTYTALADTLFIVKNEN